MDNTEDLIKFADDLITIRSLLEKQMQKGMLEPRRRALRVAPPFIKQVETAKELSGFPTIRDLAKQVGLSRETVHNFLTGKTVRYQTFVVICEKLGLDWQVIADIPREEKEFVLANYYVDITCTQASELFEKLSEQQQKIAQRIFIELIELTDLIEIQDTRKQINKIALIETLKTKEYSKNLIESVLQILTEADLIKSHQKDDVTLLEINDALIRWWDLLQKWLNEGRNFIKRGRSFETEAREWQALGKRDDELIKGMRLNLAENLSQDSYYAYFSFSFSVLAAEFVQKSVRKRNTNEAVTKIKQLLGGCRSDLTKVQETIELLEATEPDSEEFLQSLLTLRSCASNLFPYSGIIREIVHQLTEDINPSQ